MYKYRACLTSCDNCKKDHFRIRRTNKPVRNGCNCIDGTNDRQSVSSKSNVLCMNTKRQTDRKRKSTTRESNVKTLKNYSLSDHVNNRLPIFLNNSIALTEKKKTKQNTIHKFRIDNNDNK